MRQGAEQADDEVKKPVRFASGPICIHTGNKHTIDRSRSNVSKGRWMNYSLDEQDNTLIVRVDGRVDESTWEEFGAGLSEAVQHAGRSGRALVIIDLSQLDYMSSRGLRALTVAKREADQSAIAISLAAPNDVMREILSISRYDKLFTVTDSIELKH